MKIERPPVLPYYHIAWHELEVPAHYKMAWQCLHIKKLIKHVDLHQIFIEFLLTNAIVSQKNEFPNQYISTPVFSISFRFRDHVRKHHFM